MLTQLDIVKLILSSDIVKSSQTARTLAQVSTDLYDLVEQFKDHAGICNMNSYKLMQRVLSDQCHIHPDAPGRWVTVKKPAEIPADALRNPSDPDAGFNLAPRKTVPCRLSANSGKADHQGIEPTLFICSAQP